MKIMINRQKTMKLKLKKILTPKDNIVWETVTLTITRYYVQIFQPNM